MLCSVKNFEPHRPFSSPTCHTNNVERFGLTFIVDSSSAISCTATDPEPSSSAPLKIESRRVGLDFRISANSALICENCSALPILSSFSAPPGRTMRLKISTESWSTARRDMPT